MTEQFLQIERKPTRVKDTYRGVSKVLIRYWGEGGAMTEAGAWNHVWTVRWPKRLEGEPEDRDYTWVTYDTGEQAIADTAKRLKAMRDYDAAHGVDVG